MIRRILLAPVCLMVGACMRSPQPIATTKPPDISPAGHSQSEDVLRLSPSQIKPLDREVLSIDLPAVVRVALAQNIDILQARQQVEASRGRLESTVGGAFPAIAPGTNFEHYEGTVRAVDGSLIRANFDTFQVPLAIQWALNPGKVVFDLIAAKKRLLASQKQEQATLLETLRRSAVQYYGLLYEQARVSAAIQALAEARELVRISEARLKAGTGVKVDLLRAQARLAEREQDLAIAINAFYSASVNLATTLQLDSSVTLSPSVERVAPVRLVREDYELQDLLVLAAENRPDLQAIRTIATATESERQSVWWSLWGPSGGAGYQIEGIMGHADNVIPGQPIPNNLIVNPFSTTGAFSTNPLANGAIKETISRLSGKLAPSQDNSFGLKDQQRFAANLGWRFSLSAIGDMRSAEAFVRQTVLEAQRRLDQVRADVVLARQASATQQELISKSRQQLTAAEEALRLTEANLQAGTMTELDVLQAQDSVAEARLRYAGAVLQFNEAQVNLAAALGLLDEKALTKTP